VTPEGKTARPEERARGFRFTLLREVKRILACRFNLVFLLVLPLLGFAAMLLIFHQEVIRQLPVAVCDMDGSMTSRRVVRKIAAAPTMRLVGEIASPKEGMERMRRGEIYAYIFIPEHFEYDAKRGHKATAVAYYNAQWLLPGNMLNRDLGNVSASVAGEFEGKLRRHAGQPRAVAASLGQPVAIDGHPLFNPALDYRYFLTTALLPSILQICILLSTIHAFGMELKEGTAGVFLAGAKGNIVVGALGKLLPLTLAYSLVGLAMVTLLFRSLGMPLRGDFALVAGATLVFVVAYQCVGVLFIALLGNFRLSTSLAAVYAAPAFAFTGITFPIVGMPLFAKLWGAILPLTWYLKFLVRYGFHGAPLSVAMPDMLALLAFIGVCPLLGLPILAHRLRTPALWGRL
jgi:ABC-2 type transport system permease protein